MSAEPQAVWYAFTEYVRVGSRNDTLGRIGPARRPSLSSVSGLLITPAVSISEPVAESVRIVTSGRAVSIGFAFAPKNSHGSWSTCAPAHMNFAASRVEPPPTASTTSIFSVLQILTPSRTEPILGFGSMPESSKSSRPAFLISSTTLS